ncbi:MULTISPECIES: hypothetical protein [unclassified Sphingomonas]|uniref:hypothetical protein n=1 Tax=unclassified Sphingomonas TaxID=196159 RepID=UPI00226A4C5A|nr:MULTISPECIES: hypothetical protein [unclassified Sphingomonas]
MIRTGSPQPSAPTGTADRIRRLAGVALPFLAILPLEYRAPIETALIVLFPNHG